MERAKLNVKVLSAFQYHTITQPVVRNILSTRMPYFTTNMGMSNIHARLVNLVEQENVEKNKNKKVPDPSYTDRIFLEAALLSQKSLQSLKELFQEIDVVLNNGIWKIFTRPHKFTIPHELVLKLFVLADVENVNLFFVNNAPSPIAGLPAKLFPPAFPEEDIMEQLFRSCKSVKTLFIDPEYHSFPIALPEAWKASIRELHCGADAIRGHFIGMELNLYHRLYLKIDHKDMTELTFVDKYGSMNKLKAKKMRLKLRDFPAESFTNPHVTELILELKMLKFKTPFFKMMKRRFPNLKVITTEMDNFYEYYYMLDSFSEFFTEVFKRYSGFNEKIKKLGFTLNVNIKKKLHVTIKEGFINVQKDLKKFKQSNQFKKRKFSMKTFTNKDGLMNDLQVNRVESHLTINFIFRFEHCYGYQQCAYLPSAYLPLLSGYKATPDVQNMWKMACDDEYSDSEEY